MRIYFISQIVLLNLLILAGGCNAQELTSTDNGAPTGMQSSRIRIFGQNGAGAILFADSVCAGNFFSSKGEKVSGGLGSAFSSFFGSVENKPLGIPETETTRNLSKKDGIASKAYFNEYQIPPEKPTSLRLSFKDVSSFYVINGIKYEYQSPSCNGAMTFTPHAGEDYEVGFTWDTHACSLSINQVLVKDGRTEMVPVHIAPAPDC